MKVRALHVFAGSHLLVGVLFAVGSFFVIVSGSTAPMSYGQGLALLALPIMGLGTALFMLVQTLDRVEKLERRLLKREQARTRRFEHLV